MKNFLKNFLSFLTFITLAFCSPKEKPGEPIHAMALLATKGKVEFLTSKGEAFQPKTTEAIPDGTKILTQDNSSVELVLSSGGLVKVLENSDMTIDTKLHSENTTIKMRLLLQLGKVFLFQPKKLENSEVLETVTPTQIAGVRGTQFLTISNPSESQVHVLEGTVESVFRSEDVQIQETPEMVTAGQKSISTTSSLETAPLSEAEKNYLLNLGRDSKTILETAKIQMESIREQFENEKERIKIDVEKFKQENQQILQEQKGKNAQELNAQKESNAKEIQAQKDKNKELMGETKGDSTQSTRELNSSKDRQKSEIQNSSKSQFDEIKNSMKKE